jgi:hypothetical protein
MLTVCAWCQAEDPTLMEVARLNEAAGNPVSHGICESHHQAMMREVQANGGFDRECGHNHHTVTL